MTEDKINEQVESYEIQRQIYSMFSDSLKTLILQLLEIKSIKASNIEARAKTVESFGKKSVEKIKTIPTQLTK